MLTNIYLLPGLANDETVFSYLNLGDANVVYGPWLLPAPKETIENYAKRLSDFITAPRAYTCWFIFWRHDGY
jgi:hypothetical protein